MPRESRRAGSRSPRPRRSGPRCPSPAAPAAARARRALEAGDATRGDGAERAGTDQVDPDPLGPEVARKIAGDRLERRLGDAHPVIDRPGDGRVEVEPDDARAAGHQRGQRGGDRLQREGARLEGVHRALSWSGHELAPERVLGRERDRVQDAVDPPQRALQLGSDQRLRSSGWLTSSSSTSTGSGSRWAARSVIRRTRPKLVSSTSAPSACARSAT